LPDHRSRGKFRKQEAGVEVRLEHPIPISGIQIEDTPEESDAGVVDQNVDGSQRLFDLFQGRLQLPTLGEIDFQGQRRNSQGPIK
jgi:hypothetical protein